LPPKDVSNDIRGGKRKRGLKCIHVVGVRDNIVEIGMAGFVGRGASVIIITKKLVMRESLRWNN
jgi:hypothetical protein